MKKIIKLIIAIIFALAVIGGVTFLVDCSSIRSEKEPVFAKMTKTLDDGGTIIYTGLGYKIIDFNMLNGYDETKIGTWFMKYEDFKDEYQKYDKNTKPVDEDKEEDKDNSKPNSGDIEKESGEKMPQSGDTTISSGENMTASGETIENSGDKKNESSQSTQSGDSQKSGDTEKDQMPSFIGSITGIKNTTIIVTPLEDQEISKSSDMISFSIEKLENADSQNYMVGQKVKVTYTGDIKETYPAHIDVTKLEVINE